MTFSNNLLKSFSENLKQLTKMNDFLLFLRFHENRRILHCFHACKNNLISIYLDIKANFIKFCMQISNSFICLLFLPNLLSEYIY